MKKSMMGRRLCSELYPAARKIESKAFYFRSDRLHIEYGVLSDQGQVRTSNEDSYVADAGKGLFLVADGMGGHAAGEIASRIAASVVDETVAGAPAAGDLGTLLHNAVQQANTRVYETQCATPEYRGMGTTLTVLAFRNSTYYLAQVGDSRAYLLRDQALLQLSRDHSLVWPLFENGILSKDEIARHPHKHLITRCIGTHPTIEPDLANGPALEGDLYLLCSDGLTDVLNDAAIQSLLMEAGKSPQELCRNLIHAANQGGGPDNVTAVVVRLEPEK